MLVRSNADAFILAELVAAEQDERAAKDRLASAFMHRIQVGWRLLEKKETIKHDGQWRHYIRGLAAQLADQGYRPYSLRYFQEWMFLAKHLPTEQKAQPVAHLGMKRNLQRIRDDIAKKDYARRVEKGGTVSDLVALAASGKVFRVIYADPPWEFKDKQQDRPWHYDRQSLDDIKRLPIGKLAANDSALFIWAALFPDALDVITAWGFTFKTPIGFVWVKLNKRGNGLFMGMGNYTRTNVDYAFWPPKETRNDSMPMCIKS
jgi:hypothetical protein